MERKALTFRPTGALYERMLAEQERTGAPFQRMIERALDAYLPAASTKKKKRAR